MHQLTITSLFHIESPLVEFQMQPLLGVTLFQLFRGVRFIQISASVSMLLGVVFFVMGVDSTWKFTGLCICSLYGLFWGLVSFDRHTLILLCRQFEYVFLVALVFCYVIVEVLQTLVKQQVAPVYAQTTHSIALGSTLVAAVMWSAVSLSSISFDAHRGGRGYKMAILGIWGVWNLFSIYRNVFVYPNQMVNGHIWLQTVQWCVNGECMDTQTIRMQVPHTSPLRLYSHIAYFMCTSLCIAVYFYGGGFLFEIFL